MKKTCLSFIFLFLLVATLPAAAHDKSVTLNTKTLIFHDNDCKWAKKCTKNCIKTTRQQAHRTGARTCKICGG